jgi:lipoyl(octanoyl) transferase
MEFRPALPSPKLVAVGPASWLRLESGACAPAFNMALDDGLLETAPQQDRPVLRFYGWTEPAATFGYFQKISDLEKVTPLRPLVRRPTGGGLVPHDADWTYSLAFPPSHSWYDLRAEESYARIHEWIQSAFARLGVSTELAPCCRKERPGQCFAGHEKFDLLWLGRKIAGAAQRRTRNGLLIQGSVQPQPPGLGRSAWEKAMEEVATREWGVQWKPFDLPESLVHQVIHLAASKYASDSHNRRR